MRSRTLARVIASFYEAALEPDLWPTALKSLADIAGAIGACCLSQNKRSGQVEWISFAGPCANLKSDYLTYYAALDPYTPTVAAAHIQNPLWLSESVPQSVLRNNEWYNDFVTKYGISDILGGKLFENASHAVMFGVHTGGGQARFSPENVARIRQVMDPLRKASRLHLELRSLGLRSSTAIQALDQLSAAVILVDRDGHVVDLNNAADRIIFLGDGLTVRNGRLTARRSFEAARLAAAIATATAREDAGRAAAHMLIGRRDDRPAYIMTVAPLGVRLAAYDLPLAMLLIVNPEWHIPSKDAVASFFGLSPAESRLAAALMQGRRMDEIALESGVEITTLRTQLSSILRKVGVERQTDLVRALSAIGFVSPRSL